MTKTDYTTLSREDNDCGYGVTVAVGGEMRLLHYSKVPLVLRPVDPSIAPNGKPVGLWVSVEGEDDWKSWCKSEDFSIDSLVCASEIVLASEANILTLTNAFDIDLFTEQYGKSCEWSSRRRSIDWLKVAEEYQGIIIAPYVWERRLSDHTFWYYGWDCASGCIWDIKAIQSVLS